MQVRSSTFPNGMGMEISCNSYISSINEIERIAMDGERGQTMERRVECSCTNGNRKKRMNKKRESPKKKWIE